MENYFRKDDVNRRRERNSFTNMLNLKELTLYEEPKKKMNSKILGITMTIENHYPELSKYLAEMPETIPNEETPEITEEALSAYYNSLSSMLNNYMLEHYANAKKYNSI